MIEFFLSAPFVLSAIIVISVAIAVLLEFEKEGWATTLFSLGTALTLWVYKGIILDVVSNNFLFIVCFVITYVVVGLCWSLFKWKFYIGKRTKTFNLAKQKFIDSNGEIKNNWKGWITYLNDTALYTLNIESAFFESNTPEQVVAKIIPKANYKKSLIISWVSYWPMSLGATLLNNLFKKFFEWIYSLVAGIYDKMGNIETSKILVGIEKNEDEDSDKKNKKVLKG